MADIKSLEHHTLKVGHNHPRLHDENNRCCVKLQVPYEILNKKYRAAQKTLDREASHIQQATLEIDKAAAAKNAKQQDISKLLGGMVEKLQVLKRKAEESINEELHTANVCKRRLEHLKEHSKVSRAGGTSHGSLNQWRRQRLDRMVVEYFLRNGYYSSAISLAEKADIKELTNIG